MKASGWAFDRIKEAFDLVAKDEVEKMSTVQDIMLKSTDEKSMIGGNRRKIIKTPSEKG